MENSKNNNRHQLNLTMIDNGFVNDTAKDEVYQSPTERYHKKTLEALNALDKIDHYRGILGAFTKHIPIIDIFQSRGSSFDIELYDINRDQILLSKDVFEEYKKIQEKGLKKEDFEKSIYNRWLSYYDDIKNIHGEIKFIPGYIENAIKSVDKEGKYFIHLSNAFPFSLKINGELVDFGSFYNVKFDFSPSIKLLEYIANNEKIKPGSLIFVAGLVELNTYSKVLILRKEKNVNENTWTEYLRNDDKKETYYYFGTYHETASQSVSKLMSVINGPFSVYHYFVDENNYRTHSRKPTNLFVG